MEFFIELSDCPLFTTVSVIFTIVDVLALAVAVWLFKIRIIHIWWRLGFSLARNKIAIFADSDNFSDLSKVLIDSKLFKEKNIIHIGKTNIRSAESADLLLVYWPAFKDKIDEVLGVKKHLVSLVVYASPKKIPDHDMEKLNNHHNVTITNFKGRLLNDVFVSMITTKRTR